MAKRVCQLDGCDRQHCARGWCSLHYQRVKAHGDPHALRYVSVSRPGSASPSWRGSGISYRGAYLRVTSARGPARELPCVDCGEPASDWSLDHTAEEVLHGKNRGRVCPYSPNPDDYSPRCRSCHHAYDREAICA